MPLGIAFVIAMNELRARKLLVKLCRGDLACVLHTQCGPRTWKTCSVKLSNDSKKLQTTEKCLWFLTTDYIIEVFMFHPKSLRRHRLQWNFSWDQTLKSGKQDRGKTGNGIMTYRTGCLRICVHKKGCLWQWLIFLNIKRRLIQ